MILETGSETAGKNHSAILSVILAILSGVLLTLSFPDFDLWWLAWVALVPFFYAIWRLRSSWRMRTLAGWLFGTVFIYGTCWWLTYAPIHYAGVNAALAYFVMFFVAAGVGIFFALFAFIQGRLFRRYGMRAVMPAPVLWIGIEYLRFWLTGNAWNALGYSQAFVPTIIQPAKFGSFYLVGFLIVAFNAALFYMIFDRGRRSRGVFPLVVLFIAGLIFLSQPAGKDAAALEARKPEALVIAVQPNVPMSDLDQKAWEKLRQVQADTAEQVLSTTRRDDVPEVIVLPESPMNYMYERDSDFRGFLYRFTKKTNASVLFNSAEPSREAMQFYNSAVMVNEAGTKVAQYNKIHLMPFGEYVPMGDVLSPLIAPLRGSFAFGTETNLLPFGEAKGGIMICFESHFPSLSREFVLGGADVLVEMTNDGYLGPTPVLKQHLANAVFRAVETNRPLLRVTNVGISGYIRPDGKIVDATGSYVADTRYWTVARSDGSRTVYVMFGDWFAMLCAGLSVAFIALSFQKKKHHPQMNTDIHG
jgi:apolipoprotein N-acyltransferase